METSSLQLDESQDPEVFVKFILCGNKFEIQCTFSPTFEIHEEG